MLFSKGRIPDFVFEDQEEKSMEKEAQNISISDDEPFREPDEQVGGWAVWYGPGGKEGEHATEVESNGSSFDVSQYTYVPGLIEEPEDDFLKITTYVDFDDIVGNYSVSEDELEISPDLAIRWAARAGVDKIANEGGSEEFVDELPQ